MMRSTRAAFAAGTVALVATLAACGSSGSGGSSATAAAASSAGMSTSSAGMSTSAAARAAGGATLTVATTSLGKVVVGPNGHTVYRFDKDTKGSGKSACTGQCVSLWPAVTTTGMPTDTGIVGKVGTITTAGGKKQVTLDGWPLYYYAGDTGGGDVNGQGVLGIWWVLSSSGAKMTASPGGGSSTGGGYSYKTGGSY